jgi:hypothetical protein
VDPDGGDPSEGRFETFDANDRFVVVRDDEGYGVWRLEDLGEGESIGRFTDDDPGYELAADLWRALTIEDSRRRSPWLSVLKWTVIGSGLLWVASNVIATSILYLNQAEVFRDGFRDPSSWTFYQVMEVISTVGYSFTVGGTAIYVVLWLDLRRRR